MATFGTLPPGSFQAGPPMSMQSMPPMMGGPPPMGSFAAPGPSFSSWLSAKPPLLRFEHYSQGLAWDFPPSKAEKREMLMLHLLAEDEEDSEDDLDDEDDEDDEDSDDSMDGAGNAKVAAVEKSLEEMRQALEEEKAKARQQMEAKDHELQQLWEAHGEALKSHLDSLKTCSLRVEAAEDALRGARQQLEAKDHELQQLNHELQQLNEAMVTEGADDTGCESGMVSAKVRNKLELRQSLEALEEVLVQLDNRLCLAMTRRSDLQKEGEVKPVMQAIADGVADGSGPEPSPGPSDATTPGGSDLLSTMDKRGGIGAAIQSVKSCFGGGSGQNARGGVLRPSLKGTEAMKYARKEASGGVDPQVDLRPVQELQDSSESAVTCICFGQERLHKAYLLLATGSKDGTVVIYRCYRTEMETQMLSDQDFPNDEDTSSIYNQPPADHSNIAVHSRLVGHSRAITSIFFNPLEDQLVTTSIDKSVRFWGVDSAEMLNVVFTFSSPVVVARFLPFNPQVFVAANSNAVLRLANVQNGMVLQKLKVETEVRALTFDDSGLFLLAGTKNGSIHVLEASDSNNLKFKFKVQLAHEGVTCIVTCITFVGANHGQPACLLVNTSDSSATIIDCIYAPGGSLTNLSVRHRVRVGYSPLPGYLISGSEDKEVCIYSLAKGTNYKMMSLKYHQVPVVAVAVNMQDTLLASADSLGRIVLWRRTLEEDGEPATLAHTCSYGGA